MSDNQDPQQSTKAAEDQKGKGHILPSLLGIPFSSEDHHHFHFAGYNSLSSRVELPHGSRFSWGIKQHELEKFPPFKAWLDTLNTSIHQHRGEGYRLGHITVRCVDEKEKNGVTKPAFVKLLAPVTDKDNNRVGKPYVFLRGNSVAILILQHEHVLLAEQPRIAAGKFDLTELIAGKLEGDPPGLAATKEIKEETGLIAAERELKNMSRLAGQADGSYSSPGGQDEQIVYMLWEPEESKHGNIRDLDGQLRGKREEGERITLRVKKLSDLCKVPDMKAQTAWALYTNLKASAISYNPFDPIFVATMKKLAPTNAEPKTAVVPYLRNELWEKIVTFRIETDLQKLLAEKAEDFEFWRNRDDMKIDVRITKERIDIRQLQLRRSCKLALVNHAFLIIIGRVVQRLTADVRAEF
ncbi:MAG: hypothetical protein Q9162_001558 [Coniocarpon cinnabarinum]